MSNASDIEEWRPVAEFPDHYEVSNLGRVRSIPRSPDWTTRVYGGRILSPTLSGDGYPSVAICVNNVRVRRLVHLLVLKSFVGPANGLVCNHIDGDKTNNRLQNLEWITQRANVHHARDVLGKRWSISRVISDDDAFVAKALRADGVTIRTIAARLSIPEDAIQRATNGHGRSEMPKGEGHCKAKLTDDDVRTMRHLRSRGLTQERIAAQFHVGQSTVSSILRGETWAHVI